MGNRKQVFLKILIFILFTLVVSIGIVIYFLLKHDSIANESVLNNISTENINNESQNLYDNRIVNNNTSENETTTSNIKLNSYLTNVTDPDIYFLLKNCIQGYYEYGAFSNISDEGYENLEGIPDVNQEDSLWYYIDNEVKQKLNINQKNVSNLRSGLKYPKFCIDKIYGQIIDQNKDIYVVYHRLERENNTNISTVIFVKIDKKNKTFSVYPYEYLQMNNYTNLKENDVIKIDNLKDIRKKQS